MAEYENNLIIFLSVLGGVFSLMVALMGYSYAAAAPDFNGYNLGSLISGVAVAMGDDAGSLWIGVFWSLLFLTPLAAVVVMIGINLLRGNA